MMKDFSKNQKEIDTLSAKLVKVEQIEDAQKQYMEKKEKLRELSKSI
jgi:cell shape-determining protein MreC